jgi:RNA 3'-phosphate cyclase
MLKLDGSFGEGGGAILRQALALSTYTGKPFEMDNIRKGRPTPGLKAQHLNSIAALQQISTCNFTDCELGSEKIRFFPGEIKGKSAKIDIGTAGSITLLLQSFLLPSLLSGKKISFELKGGTDVKWSQPVDYLRNVLLPRIKQFGEVEVQTMNRGYYPKGQGIVKIKIKSFDKKKEDYIPFDLLNRGSLVSIRGVSHASANLEDAEVAERQARRADILLAPYKVPITIIREYSHTPSSGSGLTLWALFIRNTDDEFTTPKIMGADALGAKGVKAEEVGTKAAENLKKEIDSEGVVDAYLADQLIPFLAIVGGSIKTSKITEHTKSNIYVAEKFFDVKFEIKENTITITKVLE